MLVYSNCFLIAFSIYIYIYLGGEEHHDGGAASYARRQHVPAGSQCATRRKRDREWHHVNVGEKPRPSRIVATNWVRDLLNPNDGKSAFSAVGGGGYSKAGLQTRPNRFNRI